MKNILELKKCPVSGLKIITKPEWKYKTKDGSCTLEIAIIGDNILYEVPIGIVDGEANKWYTKTADKIISTYFSDKKYYLVYNYSLLKNASLESKKTFINWLISNSDDIKLVTVFGMNQLMKVAIKTARIISKKYDKLLLTNSYQESINSILQNHNKLEDNIGAVTINDRNFANKNTENSRINELIGYIGKMTWIGNLHQEIPILPADDPFAELFTAVSANQEDLREIDKDRNETHKKLKKLITEKNEALKLVSDNELVMLKMLEDVRVQEAKTKKANEQFETIIMGANLGWWDWDILSGEEIYNEILAKNMGYKLNEIIPHIKWWEDKIHPDDEKQVFEDLQKHFDGKTDYYDNKHRLKTKNGKWKWFSDFGKVVERDKDNKAIRMIGILRDIDKEERAEQTLRQSEQELKNREAYLNALNKISEISFESVSSSELQSFVEIIGKVANASRVYIFKNHKNQNNELLLSQAAEYTAKGIKPEIDNPDLQNLHYNNWIPRWEKTLKNGEMIRGRVADFPEKERHILGPQEIISLIIIPIFVEKNFWGFLGLDNCINNNDWSDNDVKYFKTATKRLENSIELVAKQKLLKAENKRFKITMDTMDSGIYVADMQNHELLFMNKYFVDLIGNKTGEKCYKALQGLDEPCSFCTNNILLDKNGKPNQIHIWEFQNKITNRWYQLRDQAIRWIDNKIVRMEVAEDITEKKRTERELLKTEKLKSIGTLAGGIAHDFNNILTGIYGNVSIALMKLEENHPSYKFLTKTEKSIDRATQLTRQLLTFSKGGVPVKRDVNLTKIIKETVSFDLSGSNIKPIFNFADNLMNANVDKSQMEQVFSNLTINAAQASPEGGHLYISVDNSFVSKDEILDLKSGKYLKIEVQDEGSGIPQKYIDKIFEPYFTTKQKGSGLGLATTYSIIKKHSGYIEIDSELGKGTRFTIYLPVSKNEEIKTEEKPGIINKKKNHSAKILIMDDDKVIREMSSEMIKMLGYKTASATDGKQAIALYEEAIKQNIPFDVIIMDLTIPGGMGGKETVKKILEINKNAKVIVSSGYISESVLADYKILGFIDMIDKPYTMTNLKEVLDRVLKDDFA